MSTLGLIAVGGDSIALWKAGKEVPTTRFSPHARAVTSLRWTANDRALASGEIAYSSIQTSSHSTNCLRRGRMCPCGGID
eukprot:1910582-Pleurochrysis_carterae.AAC.3